MVSLDDRVRLEPSSSVMSSSATSVVVTPSHMMGNHHGSTLLATSSSHHLHSHLSHHGGHHLGSSQQQHEQSMDDGQPDTPIDEPQDLTPTQVTFFFCPKLLPHASGKKTTRLQLIFDNATAASENTIQSKSDPKVTQK